MTTILSTLVLSDFLLMAALPTVFFRRGGRFGWMWWLTAAPFFACGRFLALARRGAVTPWVAYGGPAEIGATAAVVACSAASFVLIVAAWRAHRRPPALWHQDDDEPADLVTGGPYARIRHPLYAAYLLALAGAVLAVPHPLTAAALACGWLLLEITARREERRLCGSRFGSEYAAYMRRTGRFWPRRRGAES